MLPVISRTMGFFRKYFAARQATVGGARKKQASGERLSFGSARRSKTVPNEWPMTMKGSPRVFDSINFHTRVMHVSRLSQAAK
jgi:hypothetical protein